MRVVEWVTDLKRQLIRHEGVVPYAYQDHLGFWTIGVGRLIDKRKGGGLSDDEIDYLLDNDIWMVIEELRDRIPYFGDLSGKQKQALCNMAFQLGINGLMNFKKMLNALDHRNFEEAEREALNSKWAQQTPNRAKEVAAMLREE